jgi:hypothetical protein
MKDQSPLVGVYSDLDKTTPRKKKSKSRTKPLTPEGKPPEIPLAYDPPLAYRAPYEPGYETRYGPPLVAEYSDDLDLTTPKLNSKKNKSKSKSKSKKTKSKKSPKPTTMPAPEKVLRKHKKLKPRVRMVEVDLNAVEAVEAKAVEAKAEAVEAKPLRQHTKPKPRKRMAPVKSIRKIFTNLLDPGKMFRPERKLTHKINPFFKETRLIPKGTKMNATNHPLTRGNFSTRKTKAHK